MSKITLFYNPAEAPEEIPFDRDFVLSDYLEEHLPEASYEFWINDAPANPDCLVRVGDDVVIRLRPEGLSGATIAAIASAVLSIGSYFYFRSKLATDVGEFKNANTITGTRNRISPNGRIPVLLGKRRVYPNLASKPFSELVGDQQFYRQLFCFGYGPMKLEDFRIGDTLLTDFVDGSGKPLYEIEVQDYFENNPGELTLYPQNVDEQRVEIELEQEDVFTLRSMGPDTREISTDFLYPSGLFRLNKDGKLRSTDSLIQVEYKAAGATDYYTIVRGNLITKEINDLRRIAPSIRGTYASRGEIVMAPNGDLYAIQIPAGEGDAGRSKYFRPDHLLNPANAFPLNPATMVYDVNNNVTYVPNPDQKFIQSIHEVNTTQRGFHSGLTWRTQPSHFATDFSTTWDVRARNLAFVSDTRHTQRVDWTVLRGLKRTRPVLRGGFVLVALRIQASDQLNGSVDQFNATATSVVPSWIEDSWDESRATGMLGVGTLKDQFLNDLDTRMTRTSWLVKTLVPSQNPAELMRWIIQGPFNRRPVPDSRIDLPAFDAFRDWCNEQNFKCNFVVEEESTVLQVLNQIAFTGRARFIFNDGLFSVVIDNARAAPTQLYSDYNVTQVVSERQFLEKIDGIKARFDNELNNLYQEDEVIEFVNTGEGQGKFETLELPGITDADTAYRFARYRLAERELRREVYQIGSLLEKIRCKPGDWIRLQNKLLLIGQTSGRITAISGSQVTLNEEVEFEVGKDYGIQIRLDDFSIVERAVTAVPGGAPNTNTLLMGAPVVGLKVGDMFVFGEQGVEALDLVVETIRPTGQGNADVICRNYAPELFTIDAGEIPPFNSGITRPIEDRVLPTPFIEYIVTDQERARSERGGFVYTVRVGFQSPASAAVANADAQLEVYDSTGAKVRVVVVPITERFMVVPGLEAGEYKFRLRLIRQTNISAWVERNYTVIEDTRTPGSVPDVTGLELYGEFANISEFLGKDANFRWNRVSNFQTTELGNELFGGDEGEEDNFFSEYLVEVFTTDGFKVREEKVTANDFSYTYDKNIMDGGPRREFEIKVSVIGTEGQLSSRPAALAVRNVPPVLPSQVELFPNFSGIEIFFNRPSDLDFLGARVYLSETSPVAITPENLEYDGPDTTPIKITGLNQSSLYYFRIQLYDAFGDGDFSDEFIFSTQFIPGFDDQPPTVPGDPVITSTVRELKLFVTSEATVSWEASTDNSGFLFYRLEYWTDPAKVTVDETPLTTYNIVPIEVGVEYFFRVKAVDYSGNESEFSNTVSHTIVGDEVPPSPVTGVSVVGGLDKIILTWTNPTDSDFLFTEIYRSTTSTVDLVVGNRIVSLASEPGASSSFVDADVENNTDYWYVIRPLDVSRNAGSGAVVGPFQSFKMDFTNIDDYIEPQAIGGDLVAVETIQAVNIAPLAITEVKIDTSAVTAAKIATAAITETKIADDAISTPKLQVGSVQANQIAAGSVVAGKIAANAVEANTIAANAITAVKIAADAVTANKIEAGAVVAGKIAANAVSAGTIAANAVVAGKIAANAVTSNEITANAIDAKHTITGAVIRTSASNPRVQLDSTNGVSLFNSGGTVTSRLRVDGSGYFGLVGGSPAISWNTAGVVTVPGALIATGIDAANITTGFLNAGRIQAGSINASKLTVTTLSSITADFGVMTSGLVIGAIIETNSNPNISGGIQLNTTSFNGWNTSGQKTLELNTNGSGFIGLGSTNRLSWNASGVLTLAGTFSGSEIISPVIRTAASGWRAELGPNVGGSLIRVTNGSTTTFSVDVSGNATFSGNITGSTITGGVLRTSSSGSRLEIGGAFNDLRVFNSDGNVRARVGGFSGGSEAWGVFGSTAVDESNIGLIARSRSTTALFAESGIATAIIATGETAAELIGDVHDVELGASNSSVHSTSGGHVLFNAAGSSFFGRPTWNAPGGTLVARREVSGGQIRLWLQQTPGNTNSWVGLGTF